MVIVGVVAVVVARGWLSVCLVSGGVVAGGVGGGCGAGWLVRCPCLVVALLACCLSFFCCGGVRLLFLYWLVRCGGVVLLSALCPVLLCCRILLRVGRAMFACTSLSIFLSLLISPYIERFNL